MVRDEIKNLTQGEVLKNANNLTGEELRYHGIKRIPFDEIPAVYVDDIEDIRRFVKLNHTNILKLANEEIDIVDFYKLMIPLTK